MFALDPDTPKRHPGGVPTGIELVPNRHPVLPKPSPNVVFRRVGDGGVLLSLKDEVYYGLNSVGARIWELLPPQSEDFDALLETLAREYGDVNPSVIAEDASDLLRDLERNGLVLVNGIEP